MTTAVTRKDYGELGPAMKALPPKWQTFVEAYVLETFRNNNKNNHGAQAYAARAAGYGNANSKPLQLAQQGYRLMRDPRVQAAIAEESRNMRRNAAPEVIKAWLNVLRDPSHAGHIRAIAMGLDRDEPLVTQQKIDVQHTYVDRNTEEIE
jgi:hypothetical protein